MESRLQVKMNSPESARDVSIKQEEPEDHPHPSMYFHYTVALGGNKCQDNDNSRLLELSVLFYLPKGFTVL